MIIDSFMGRCHFLSQLSHRKGNDPARVDRVVGGWRHLDNTADFSLSREMKQLGDITKERSLILANGLQNIISSQWK